RLLNFMLALLLACIVQGNPKQALDAFVAAEAANSKQSLTIVVSSNLSSTSTKTTYELAFIRPNRLRMEVRENAPPTDRVFAINRNLFTAYDRLSNQVLTRKVRADGTLGEKLADAFGEVDEPVMLVINPSKAREFADRMQALPGWRVFHSSLLTVLDDKSAATHTSAAIGLQVF